MAQRRRRRTWRRLGRRWGDVGGGGVDAAAGAEIDAPEEALGERVGRRFAWNQRTSGGRWFGRERDLGRAMMAKMMEMAGVGLRRWLAAAAAEPGWREACLPFF